MDQVASSLYHDLVQTVWQELRNSGTLQMRREPREPDRHDLAEDAAIAYHAGWCVIAVRKHLQHKKEDSTQHLKLLQELTNIL